MASASPWINPLVLDKYAIAATKYKAMGTQQVVTAAATKAGQLVVDQAKSLIKSQPDLQMYSKVSSSLGVWSDDEGVYVGIEGNDPLADQASQMDTSFPVLDTALQMVGSQLAKTFETALLTEGKTVNSAPTIMQAPSPVAEQEGGATTNESI